MLIIEGPDLVGKTSLCQKLVQKLSQTRPYVYTHFSKLPESWHYYRDYLPHMQRYVVRDRFYLSEVAYRHARNEDQRLDPETYRLLDAHARFVGAFTVVVLAEASWLRAKYAERPRPETHTEDQIIRANYAFDMLVAGSLGAYQIDHDMVYTVSYGQCYPSSNEEFISRVLERYQRRQARLWASINAVEKNA